MHLPSQGKHRQNYRQHLKKVKSRHSFRNMIFLSTTLLLLALESSRDSDVRSAVSSCPEGKQRSFGGSWQLAGAGEGAGARAIVHPSLVIHTTSSAVCAAGIGVIAPPCNHAVRLLSASSGRQSSVQTMRQAAALCASVRCCTTHTLHFEYINNNHTYNTMMMTP